MAGLAFDQVSKIGFNDPVQVNARTFHVQTEVVLRDGIMIRTTVLEAGVVKLVDARPCASAGDELGAFRALVEAQHEHYIQVLNRSGATWLE